MLRTPAWPALTLALSLAACGGGGGSSSSSTSAAATAAPAVSGRVPGAPPGTVVHLVAPEAAAPDEGLLGHAAAIVATVDVDDAGAFSWPVEADLPAPSEALVSAPGRALLRAPLAALRGQEVALAPEAVIEARATDPAGAPEVDAVAMILDATGAPVPVPPDGLGTDRDGRLRVTRLPAGDYTLLVGSADARRHALARVAVGAGERAALDLRLAEDPDLERRYIEAALGRAGAAALLEGSALEDAHGHEDGEEVAQ